MNDRCVYVCGIPFDDHGTEEHPFRGERLDVDRLATALDKAMQPGGGAKTLTSIAKEIAAEYARLSGVAAS